ncbi:MAG: aminotransferase class IV [Gemmatimonadota bacterium]
MPDEFVHLNGAFVRPAEAKVSVLDRGFTFADGVYEVIRIVAGRGFRLDDHRARLERGCAALEIQANADEWASVMLETARRNGVREGTVYLQVTRGAATRQHAFPGGTRPTVVAWTRPFPGRGPEEWDAGVSCITLPDERHGLCEIKTTSLLPNVLANEKAHRAGAYEAVLVRDGVVTEGSHASVLAVFDGVVWTHPIRNILPGVTRALALAAARDLGIPVREEGVPIGRLREADEIFLTGTTTEVLGVVRLDGAPVGGGKVGPVTRKLYEAYRAEVDRVRRSG